MPSTYWKPKFMIWRLLTLSKQPTFEGFTLELSGDYPRTHSIIRLLNELKAVNRREVEAFIRKNRSNLHSLEDAYITSRYFVKTFEREDGEYLVKQAERVIRFGEKLKKLLGKGKNR